MLRSEGADVGDGFAGELVAQAVQHAACIFKAGCVVEVNQAVVAVVDEGFFDMARGGWRVFYFAEGAVAQKRT